MSNDQKVLTKLDKLEKAVEKIANNMATKDYLERFITKEDAKNLATKADLEKTVTKEDAKRFATKDDLEKFITKEDAKQFATKDDLKQFTTKKDLNDLEKRFEQKFATKDDLNRFATKDDLMAMGNQITEDISSLISSIVEEIDKQKADRKDVNQLEKRVEELEKDQINN